jgi:hypothetical protein
MPFIPAFYDSPDPRIHWDNPNLFWDLGLWVEGDTMPDAQIKIDLDKLSDEDLIARAKLHKKGLADNAAIFTDPQYLADVTAAITDAEAKVGAKDAHEQAGKTLTTQKNQSIANLLKVTKKGAKYVDLKADGNPATMQLGGFGPRAPGAPPNVVAVTSLAATYGDSPGEIELQWNPTEDAIGYIMHWRVANSNAPFQKSAPVTPSKGTLTGLTPGELYELSVCAVYRGQDSPGPMCPTIEHRAA